MAPQQKRRKTDSTLLLSGAKATGAFLFFGALSFIGTWGVGLSNTVSKLREDVSVIHEKQEFLAPWMVDEIKRVREELKEVRNELKQMNDELRKRR